MAVIIRGEVDLLAPLDRATVIVGADVTIKQHKDVRSAENEARWYRIVPWAAPQLIHYTGRTLIIETLPTCWSLKDWQPAQEVAELIRRLHAEGIHHRDVHPGNIVRSRAGRPLFIDWETAVRQPTDVSYDLAGPVSGVSAPEEHQKADYSQWWHSPSSCSLAKVWSHDVPT